jgi:hydroxymethylpyrimidine pyrophosphatase-like HAD family hydrolase
MQKLKYKLIISDFDGTLVCDDGRITEENKRAIKQYVADGGKFAISTGRMHYGVIARAKELGLTGVICCSQGAVIMDIETQKFLLNGMLSADITLKICKKMETLGLHYHIYEQEMLMKDYRRLF